ncbi:RHS repeat-associated core domain-containing protein [Piscinibacter sp.]|uniref:RHS repeat-associated core domain-containing protein n=1 Tax=Piscinibacter sp. TaxID=1903157 RepID=UPI0039E5DF6E
MGDSLRDISYDAADRITGYQHYDASTGAAQAALDQSFAYDELGRLTGITTASASWSIGYDANGNRTGLTLNGTTSAYTTASTSNRLTGTTNPARSFGYDNAGNTVSDTYTASYNLAGRMATLLKAGTTTTYSVDGFGRRVRKFDNTGAASTVLFVYDQQGQLLGEYNSSGTAIREYVWLGNVPVAVFTPDPANAANPPLVYYIHTDHLATPRIVLNTAGQQRWSWLAEPFGTSAPNANPQSLGTFTFNLRHPGQYADAESGLFYNYFRDYDASTGRYAQSDPIGLVGDINTYAYVGGNPVSFVDPPGLDAIFVHYIGYSVAITNDISAPLGHAGAVAVDPVTGKTQYYDFGRYGGKCGDVRGPFDVGRVVFDKDGNPTRASIEAVLKTASSAYGKNSPTYYEYSKKPYQDVIDYAERRKREADTCERPYKVITDNCKNFGREAAGR